MKVLWLCNQTMPMIASKLKEEFPSVGGWLQSAANEMIKENDVRLIIVYPQTKQRDLVYLSTEYFDSVGFCFNNNKKTCNKKTESDFEKILNKFKPDIIHIWGTEFPHTLSMVNAVKDKKKIVISIQGLCSIISEHYLLYLPNKFRRTFRDIVKNDGLNEQKNEFSKRGINEIKALQNVENVIGRTEWDKICVTEINRNIRYYHCDENLRNVFYNKSGEWSIDNIEKHRIFVSQSDYPIKGFHILLKAAKILKKEFPDLKIYTTGKDPRTIKKYRISGYHKIIVDLINEYDLNQNIFYLGTLTEKEMCDNYLRSEIFVSPSIIENSSNSIAEAMILGVPVIASFSGGTMSLIRNRIDGILYQTDAYYMLAGHIRELFLSDDKKVSLGKEACKSALIRHNKIENQKRLIGIYNEINGGCVIG